ncbi:MAG: hypothetical protein R2843_01060 [Thermomicrobiales bacterium]
MNFIETTIQGEGNNLYAVASSFKMRVPDSKANALGRTSGKAVTLGVRPEHLLEKSHAAGLVPDDSFAPVTVDVIELLGNEIFVYLMAGNRAFDRPHGRRHPAVPAGT